MPSTPPTLDAPPDGSFCQGYKVTPNRYDEMIGLDGGLRPHWLAFFKGLDTLGRKEFTRRWEESRRLIRENGVTYNVYGDSQGMERPWKLDPIPLVISASEARNIEAGLIQRAQLLELILADLYGPQKLLRQDLLPPELVLANPGFLRPCHDLRLPGNRYLSLYAADLGRTPDGSILVLKDRTQAPSGAGYALENRIVLSRMLPDVFGDCQVERLALFFRAVRDTLRGLAPHNRDNPRIVVLTPGPYNETYFEHAYLARYLGYTLVEGGDLTVRDNRVFLKLLGGLQPVDVILRRLDDDFCDPVELRGDSSLGVPGLIQAIRAGNVAVANPLGTGLVETVALHAYLPSLCRHFLGEDLLLPSPPVWWCGDPAMREHVLANLQQMVIKPTYSSPRFDSIFCQKLTAEESQFLKERIRAEPSDFVGQEVLNLSLAPVWIGDRLRPRHVVIRAYLTATEDSFDVMPGGLTRVTTSSDSLVVSMQKGGGSKDTWMLASGPVSTFSLLPPPARPLELTRGGEDLPSRAADNFFWLGRYIERVEGMVRLFRAILVRLTEKTTLAEVPELPILLQTLTQQTLTYPGFVGRGADTRLAAPETELLSLVFDGTRPGSLDGNFQAIHRIARMVRDRISADTWKILNGLNLHDTLSHGTDPFGETPKTENHEIRSVKPGMANLDSRVTLTNAVRILDRTIFSLTAIAGLVMENMTRGGGWRFLDMGRRLERSAHIITLLGSTLSSVRDYEGPLLEALLEIADSSMTYRRRYQASVATPPVLDLLLADESNPRSLAYQLATLAGHVEKLPRPTSFPGLASDQRITLRALTTVRLADVNELSSPNSDGHRPKLAELLTSLGDELPAFSDTITRDYFSHAQATRHFALRAREASPRP